MRGKDSVCNESAPLVGITPAYAGKSCRVADYRQGPWDHPRVCGEKNQGDGFTRCRTGSPPRMRGKVCERLAPLGQWGITPAYAGKRDKLAIALIGAEDHPRVCGEKRSAARAVQAAAGSPPRMRGKAPITGQWAHTTRITPAYAGKSLSPAPEEALPGDHPRVCGEKCKMTPVFLSW